MTGIGKLTKEQLNDYDYIIVAFSGGKDSTACLLDLIESGADKNKIELWHHDIDGRESGNFMDWLCTPDYCKKFAKALGIPIYFSWKQGGFLREMLRDEKLTAPTSFETPEEGIKTAGGVRGKLNTRRKFPQISPDLSVRWCSAYLKVDVCTTAIINQKRFVDKKTLLVSGERAEESASRAKYKVYEPDRADNRNGKRVVRHVDRYRPVHAWKESQIWKIIEKYNIKVHPAYYIGWGRVSCASCIFGSPHQWASLNKIAPEHIKKVVDYETEFDITINRKKSVLEMIESGTPYQMDDMESIKDAMNKEYNQDIIIQNWTLPAGAYGESCGPV